MAHASAFGANSPLQGRTRDSVIAAYAGERHGVVSHRELIGFGLKRRAIAYRLERGRLHEIHRGVYAVGHRVITTDGARRAAVLAGGPRAAVSHGSAGAMAGFRADSRALVEISVPSWRRDRPGIRQHQAVLAADEVTVIHHIPVTTVGRTLLDLAAVLPRDHLERAIKEAEYLRVFDRNEIERLLARYPRRHGTRALRQILDIGVDMRETKSEMEEKFITFLTGAVLPQPETNQWLELNGTTIQVDCLWRRQRVALELDGRQAHATRAAFENDRRRDRILSVAGYRPIRVTWRQLRGERAELEADLRSLLRLPA